MTNQTAPPERQTTADQNASTSPLDAVVRRTVPRFLIMYSGGVCSWSAARRIVAEHGTDGVVLLFADTMIEDEDLCRFLLESAEHLGVALARIADGRTPWEVFRDERFIGNSRVDPCSKILKRKLMERWRDEHCDPERTTLVFGLDWNETHRIKRHSSRMAPWRCLYPMADKPWLSKDDMLSDLRADGIRPPRLYELGFRHNNCGGFCVKMGLGQAKHLLTTLPERYRMHEEAELATMAAIGPTAGPCLRLGSGDRRPITLRAFREMVEAQPLLYDDHGWGCGGGCAIDE